MLSKKRIFILTTLIAVICFSGWFIFSSLLLRAKRQREGTTTIFRNGGEAIYDYQVDEYGVVDKSLKPPVSQFLLQWLGVDFFQNVQCIYLEETKENQNLSSLLGRFPSLKKLHLSFQDGHEAEFSLDLSGLKQLRILKTGFPFPLHKLRSHIGLEKVHGIGEGFLARLEKLENLEVKGSTDLNSVMDLFRLRSLAFESPEIRSFNRLSQQNLLDSLSITVDQYDQPIRLNELRTIQDLSVRSTHEYPCDVILPENVRRLRLKNVRLLNDSIPRNYPKLEELRVSCCTSLEEMFRKSTFPSLKRLTFADGEELMKIDSPKRTFPNLKEIEIIDDLNPNLMLSDLFPVVDVFRMDKSIINFVENSSYLRDIKHLQTSYEYEIFEDGFLKRFNQQESFQLVPNSVEIRELETVDDERRDDSYRITVNKNLEGLVGSKNLKWLSIPTVLINDFRVIGKMKSLKGLNVSGNENLIELTESDKKALAGLKNLEQLMLCRTKSNDFHFLKELPNLKALVLNTEKLNDLKSLSELKNLEYLCLCNMTIADLDGIEGLQNLKTLVLEKSHILDARGITKAKKLREVYAVSDKTYPMLKMVDLAEERIAYRKYYLDEPNGVYFLDNPNLQNEEYSESSCKISTEDIPPSPEFVRRQNEARW